MAEMTLLQETWQEYRAAIDSALEGYLDQGPHCPEKLREATQANTAIVRSTTQNAATEPMP
jgi:hypothetical protein